LQLKKDGFRHWFNQEEIKEINANNEQYQLRSPEEELLLTWFEPADETSAEYFLNTTQIAQILASRANLSLNDTSVRKVGMALKKHGFKKIVKKRLYVYPVNIFEYEDVSKQNKSYGEDLLSTDIQQEIPFRFSN
jgi:predicted P-loop ATPase